MHHLSIQYEVPELIQITTEYIKKNKKRLIFELILFKTQNDEPKVNFNLSTEEEIIAENFFDLIENDKIFSLPITVLYRILSKQQLNLNSIDSTKQSQLINYSNVLTNIKKMRRFCLHASILRINESIY